MCPMSQEMFKSNTLKQEEDPQKCKVVFTSISLNRVIFELVMCLFKEM